MNLALIFILFSLIGAMALDSALSRASYSVDERGDARLYLAAVAHDDGIIIPIDISAEKGSGKILMNIDNPLFITDTQQSIKTAVEEAARISGRDASKFDFMFSMDTDAALISGPSAGAALAIGAVAAMTNTPLRDDVVITGGISYGGRITPVGGIKEKAQAAFNAGKKMFLVPIGESINREPVEKCVDKDTGRTREKRCTISYKSVGIEEMIGIRVIEVGTVQEALNYMVVMDGQ